MKPDQSTGVPLRPHGGHRVAIVDLPKRKNIKSDEVWSVRLRSCPFCGERHTHGGGKGEKVILGWRVPHCPNDVRFQYYLTVESEIDKATRIVQQANTKQTEGIAEGGTMRPYVKLFKDGDQMAVETNCIEERDFLEQLALAIEALIESNRFKGDWEFQLRFWLPQAFEILSKLRGYKSTVVETRILQAGAINPHPSHIVHDTTIDAPESTALTADAPTL